MLPAVPVNRAVAIARRATMLSLPACVTSRAKWLGTVEIDNNPISYLSAGLTPLSETEVGIAKSALANLETVLEAADDDAEDTEKMTMLTKMFMAKPSAGMTALGAAARGESYVTALYDLPAWAIEDAINRWYRGAVDGVPYEDFKWAPDTAMLRRIALSLLQPYRENAKTIRALLAAKPLAEVLK